MITADRNFTIPPRYADKLGWNAMYDRTKDALIERGVILTYVDPTNEIQMFETSEDLNLLESPEEIAAVPGSCYMDTETGAVPNDIGGFHLDRCRFPTQEELDWYVKLETV